MCLNRLSQLKEQDYKTLLKIPLMLGLLQILSAIIVVIVASSVWWFSVLAGISGTFTLILAIIPHHRFIATAVLICSIVSLITSVSFLVYIQKWCKEDRYGVLVLIGVLQSSFAISCLVLLELGIRRFCCCIAKERNEMPSENDFLMPSAPSESPTPPYHELQLNITPYIQGQPINILSPRTPQEDFVNHYDAFPQFASHSR